MKRYLGIGVVVTCLVFAGYIVAAAATMKELNAAKNSLNNTQWTITLKPMFGKGASEADVISFVNGELVSRNLQNAGYQAAGFTVRIKDEETVTWNTMQKDDAGNMVFWTGDIKNGVMKGVMSKHDKRGRAYDFSFISQ